MNLFKKALIAVLGLGLVVAPSANRQVEEVKAATINQSTQLYLKPNSNWTSDNARFAIYFFGNGDAWVSMDDSDGDGIYEAKSPSNKTYSNLIFCRMNPSASANNWNNKWNQTGNLTYDGSKNMFTMNADSWDAGTWSTFVPPTFTLAGSELYGVGLWDVADKTYTLEKQTDNSYTTVARFGDNAKFKVITDGSWNNTSYGGNGTNADTDGNFVVAKGGIYKVTFKNHTVSIAEYTPENHLSVKYQQNSETGAYRVIGTFGDVNYASLFNVDEYTEVGFELTWNGKPKTTPAGYVYTSVTADGAEVSAAKYGAQYFFCFTFNNVPEEGSFTARAYAKHSGGYTEYGSVATLNF